MEICTLVKFSTNKGCWLCLIIILCLFASCQSNKINEYVRPDFSDIEILENEIGRIRDGQEDNPAYALWLAHILYDETHNDAVRDLYVECYNTALKQFDEKIQSKQWFDALRLSNSILSLNELVSSNIQIEIENTIIEKVKLAQQAYENLSLLKNSSNTISEGGESIATFITGVVTVWVDLGVVVERGLGYPNRSLGSGFFIDERGYIITNHHVIEELVDPEYEGYSKLYIKLSHDSETRIPAKVVGWDKTLDLALLKTEITPPFVYTLGSSENLTIGNQIYAIGSPVGLENTITSGIISAFDRQLLSTAAVMQIDAAVNSGNSGGPLINTNGEVQGIVFAGLPTYQGLNFAIPVEYLRAILLRLYSQGEVNHSWIGAYGRTIKRYPADELGLGVEVLYVMPGSPAYIVGLKPGDIITQINNIPVTSIEELQYALIHLAPESIVFLDKKTSVDGINEKHAVYLEHRPEQPGLQIYEREPEYKMVYPLFGMELIPSSVGNKNQYTVQSIIKGSIADESGFSVHDHVEIMKSYVSENEDAVFIESFTKKRKSGYFEVSVGIGAPLDSLYLF